MVYIWLANRLLLPFENCHKLTKTQHVGVGFFNMPYMIINYQDITSLKEALYLYNSEITVLPVLSLDIVPNALVPGGILVLLRHLVFHYN